MGLADQVSNFSAQVNQLVAENQHLRVKSDNDDQTLALMKSQYDSLAASVSLMRTRHESEMHDLRTERDQAVIAFKEIDSLLLQSADIVMQALRARKGNATPAEIPDRPAAAVDHPALPPNIPFAPPGGVRAVPAGAEVDDGLRDLVRRLPGTNLFHGGYPA